MRKVVFIIGNGFDLDLGYKTSYKDFWRSKYCPKTYPSPLIFHLNQKWKNKADGINWYDLENELLNYYSYNSKGTIWNDVVDDNELTFLKEYEPYKYACFQYQDKIEIINGLIEKKIIECPHPMSRSLTIQYLEEFNISRLERDIKSVLLIKEGLTKYLTTEVGIGANEKSIALASLFAVSEAQNRGDNLFIYNFNYTPLPVIYNARFKKSIKYVHGECKKRNIIIGTKDDKNFSKEYDFLQKSFDPNFNPPPIVYDLLDADDIIIYGHSLGISDIQYFMSFFKQQSSAENPNKKFIRIITKDSESEIEIKRSLEIMTDYKLSMLASLNDFKILKSDEIYSNPKLFQDFFSRYVNDLRQVDSTISQLSKI